MDKETKVMQGFLIGQLTVGRRALIFSQGHILRTSPVVKVLDVSDEETSFETVNTHYTLLGTPLPGADSDALATGMAA